MERAWNVRCPELEFQAQRGETLIRDDRSMTFIDFGGPDPQKKHRQCLGIPLCTLRPQSVTLAPCTGQKVL